MGKQPRLSLATLDSLRGTVVRPGYAIENIGVRHVHLGVGAFMRAHIACYNDAAMNVAGGDWGIAGVSLRKPDVYAQLAPQDCLYSLCVVDSESESYRLIGSIRSIDVATEKPQKIIDRIADPLVEIVTLTVTEKGYSIEPESGALDTANADVIHDLENPGSPRTTLGFLAAGLRLRSANRAGALTLMSCDNLPHNGARLRRALSEFVELASPQLTRWLDDNVCFPSTMVDRIVPATTPADIERAAEATGVSDAGLVCTEPFTQWVIEDNFSGSRPAWDQVGALLVQDVEPYELAKLRLLNGAHSSLAYLGFLAGNEFVHEVMRNRDFVTFLRYMMQKEISPVTPQPEGMQHSKYIEELLQRFSNEALNHRTWQIAMDGSQKLPQRLLNTIREQLKAGGSIAGLALAVAGWIQYTQGRDEQGNAIDVSDPLADRFADIATRSTGDPDDLVSHYLEIEEVFGVDLATQSRFTATLAGQLRDLQEKGALQLVADFAMRCGHS